MEIIKNLEEYISNKTKKYEKLKSKYENLESNYEKLKSKYENLECRNLNNNIDISSKIPGSKIITSSFCKDGENICSEKKWKPILIKLYLYIKKEKGYDYFILKIKNNNNFNYCDKKQFNKMEKKKGYSYYNNLQIAIQNKSATDTYKEIKKICDDETIKFMIYFEDTEKNFQCLHS